MDIGQKIYNLRKENGYSQEMLAEKLGTQSEVIAQWENGTTPELVKIIEISNLFNVSTDSLLKDDSIIQEVEISEEAEETIETVEGIRILNTNDIKNYINNKTKYNKQISYFILFVIIGLGIPLAHCDFNIIEIFDFTQGSVLKIISIIVFAICTLVALVLLLRAQKYDIGELSDFVLSTSAKNELDKMYQEFKVNKNSKFKLNFAIFIMTSVAMYVSLELFYDVDFVIYTAIDLMIIFYGYVFANIIYMIFQSVDYITFFQTIKKEEKKRDRIIAKIKIGELARTPDGIEILTANDVEKCLVDRHNRGEEKLIPMVLLLGVAVMPLVYYNFNIFELINFIDYAFFTKETLFRIFGLIIFNLFTFLSVKSLFNFIFQESSEFSKNDVFILKHSAETKLKEMHETSKKQRENAIFWASIFLAAAFILCLIIVVVFDIGSILDSIILDIVIFIFAGTLSLIINNLYQEMGYRALFENVKIDETEKIKTFKKLKAREKVQNYNATHEKSDKKGVEILNATELDRYIKNKIRYGKNIGRAIMFFALATIPFMSYLYSSGQVFNRTALDNTPRAMFIISNICIFIALAFICISVSFNYKFDLNVKNDFIFNEFTENKLMSKYKKFKTKKMVILILTIIIFLIAVMSNLYVVYMFNGSVNMFYNLLSIVVFLYALATYFIIAIIYEQSAYRNLLKNVG